MQWQHQHSGLHHSHLVARASVPNFSADTAGPASDMAIPRLLKRDCSSGDDTDPSCKSMSGGDHTISIAIACGIVIPLVLAFILFCWLHRRHVKQLRSEDLNDKHGSLDFGLGEVARKQRGKKGQQPEMTISDVTDARMLHTKGLSMDMGSPYVIPDGAESRPSFNSLSRSAHDGEDPYRPVQQLIKQDSHPSTPRSAMFDSASEMTYGSDVNLVPNAQKPPVASPYAEPLPTSSPFEMAASSNSVSRKPVGLHSEAAPSSALSPGSEETTLPTENNEALTLPTSTFQSNFSLPDNVSELPTGSADVPASVFSSQSPPPPPKRSSLREKKTQSVDGNAESNPLSDYTTYADVLGIAQAPTDGLPTIQEPSSNQGPTARNAEPSGLGVQGLSFAGSRLSTVIRPLPPEDPADSAEQRANRIRSFYKEYFDDSVGAKDYGGGAEYYEGYGQEFLNDATVYDPATGEFITAGGPAYAQPMTRRAMTPPPRGPPRFRGGPAAGATRSSGGTYPGGRMRAFSSASGRPPIGARGRPRKNLPPPTPLQTLPTPSKLKEDHSLFNPLDFAPPTTYRDRVAGKPQSPGGADPRPYSPSVRAHTPLMSSFDDLAVIPSPHALRKSGTFTTLDFAPPPRVFKNSDSGSDKGSIHSARSNLSPMQAHNIRAGAYRVSRLPPGAVGTRDDLAATLKPRMDMVMGA